VIVYYCDTPEEFRDQLVEELTVKVGFLDAFISRKEAGGFKNITKKEFNAKVTERNTLRQWRDNLKATNVRPAADHPFKSKVAE